MPHTQHPIELLRFNTCGSVDDGKSTLIGRLLYDSKNLMEDQIEALERSADITGGGQINLANLTDGLLAEREQGITIYVAYRYFAMPKRKFIVADTPGHVQYTRNMVTGASTANLSIVLVDARQGVIEQTRRHTFIAALLGIPHLVIAVNKMDLVDWSEERYTEIRDEIEDFLPKVAEIWTYGGSLDEAFCPQSVTVCLEHDIDISRGDMLVGLENLPGRSADLHAQICWMHSRPLQAGKKYFLKHATQTVQAIVSKLESRINMTTLEPEPEPAALAINDIGAVRLKTAKPIVFDGYTTNRLTGSFILIEQGTNATVAAGMLSAPTEAVKPEYADFAI